MCHGKTADDNKHDMKKKPRRNQLILLEFFFAALALCDWSTLQQKRRNLARKHCSPRDNSTFFKKMNDVGCSELDSFVDRLRTIVKPEGTEMKLKPLIMETCANLFSLYMCSTRYDVEDADWKSTVRCFDEIFWEINQGYAVDFLPWLSPFYTSHMRKLESWSKTIREYVMERVIKDRAETLHERSEDDDDFTDALLRSLSKEQNVTKDTIIYMLEDFLGGHSAIGESFCALKCEEKILSIDNHQVISCISPSATS